MPKCKGCGQEIKWVEMATGKKMPLDAKPMQMVQVKEDIGEVIPVYMPHKDFMGNVSEGEGF